MPRRADARSGTTSVFSWMYESVYGKPWDATHNPLRPPWVQDLDSWPRPPRGGKVGTRYQMPPEGTAPVDLPWQSHLRAATATAEPGGLELITVVREYAGAELEPRARGW